MTLSELGAVGENMKPFWVGIPEEQVYTGAAIKPSLRVYCGVALLTEKKDYSVSFKNNKNAGTASATVKFKGYYKKQPLLKADFRIRPAEIGYETELYPLPLGVRYTQKAQQPKPLLLRMDTGETIPFNKKDFTITYYNAEGEEVSSVREAGSYWMHISATPGSKNYRGSCYQNLTVAEKDLAEKLKVKIKTPKFRFDGSYVFPVYGKDFTIVLPKGYDPVAAEAEASGNNSLTQLDIEYVHNRAPGKMAMLINGKDGSSYSGTKLVYFTITK